MMQYRGHTSDEEIAEAVRIAQADKRFDSIKYDIHDFRLCEEFGFSQPKICEIAAIDGAAALSLPHKQMAVAVVTDRPDVIASVNAYVSSGFNVHSVHICSSIDEARDWLSSVLKA